MAYIMVDFADVGFVRKDLITKRRKARRTLGIRYKQTLSLPSGFSGTGQFFIDEIAICQVNRFA